MPGRYSRSLEAEQYRHLFRTALWRKIRLQHLASEPLCRMCKARDRITPASVCDHIQPHKGDEALFFAGPFQSLCKPCHDRHKQSEERRGYSTAVGLDGWPVDERHPANGGKPARTDGLGTISHPRWFRPVYVPLTIVCGPPASGKTSYVETHKGPRDIVFDLDAIAIKHYGKRVSLLPKERLLECLKHRNEALADLMWAKARGSCDMAWLIVAEPKAHKRQWWQDTLKPERIIVLETPAEQCIARAAADQGHARARNIHAVIRQWWATYVRRHGEVVIDATGGGG